jgi:hypothetical protein
LEEREEGIGQLRREMVRLRKGTRDPSQVENLGQIESISEEQAVS